MNGKVYKITNNVTGESYIGKTIRTIEERFKEHCHGTERDDGRRSLLQKAMAEYGYRNFSIELLMDGIESQERLDEVETGFMVAYGTLNEYNKVVSYNEKSRSEERNQMNIFSDNIHLPAFVWLNKSFSSFEFSTLSNLELTVLMIVISIAQKDNEMSILLDLTELKKLEIVSLNQVFRAKELLSNIIKKGMSFNGPNLASLIISYNEVNEGEIEVQLNDEYRNFILNQTSKTAVKIENKLITKLRRSNSVKIYIYSLLNIGEKIKLDEFVRIMNPPKSYSPAKMQIYFLEPSIEEINRLRRKSFLNSEWIRKGRGGKINSVLILPE